MSAEEHVGGGGEQPSEEELRAALEEQLRRLTVDDLLIQSTVSLINLAGRRLGLGPDGEEDRDLEQVRDAIDAVTALLPVLERRGGTEQLRPLRDALAQLQMEYARLARGDQGTGGPGEAPPGNAPPQAGAPPAQSSGRLWVPGQP
jgi:hypothetical protein